MAKRSDQQLARLHIWQIQAVRDVLAIAAAISLVWIGYALRTVTIPLLAALLLAYLFEPLVSRLSQRPQVSRPFVVGGLVTSFVIVIVLIIALLVPLVIGQTVRLVNDVREGRLQQTVISMRDYVPEQYRDDLDHTITFFGNVFGVRSTDDSSQTENDAGQDLQITPEQDNELRKIVRDEVAAQLKQSEFQTQTTVQPSRDLQFDSWVRIIKRSGSAVVGFLGGLLQVGFLLFLIPFYFFFFSLWYPDIVRFGEGLIPENNKSRVVELLNKMDRAVAGFVRGRIVICLLMGVMFAIGWSICGVPYAIVVGLLIGIFSAVPYLGGIGIPVAVGLLWIKELGEPVDERMMWLWIIAGPVIVFAIVQVIEAWILTPMIQGKATNLDPVTILVAVLAGGSVLGIYGMLLAIPLTACGKILITDVWLPRVKEWSAGRAEDPLPISRD